MAKKDKYKKGKGKKGSVVGRRKRPAKGKPSVGSK